MMFRHFNKAIVLLTRYPNNLWLNFLHNFQNYDIYVFIDDNTKDFKQLFESVNKKINFIQLDDDFCQQRGYYNSLIQTGNVPNKVLAWDKALLYFCWLNNNYEHIWLVEDDVFFLNEELVFNMDNYYKDADLLTPEHCINSSGNTCGHQTGWPHWHCAHGRFNKPWAKSMVCMCRLSRRLLCKIKEYKNNHGKLEFHEILFNTLAMHNNMKVETPPELSKIDYLVDWGVNIDTHYCYHPMKTMNHHNIIREKNMIYFDNLFNNINYKKAKNFSFNEFQFYIDNLPEDFDFDVYLEHNISSMADNSKGSIAWDWFHYGQYENKIYKIDKQPEDCFEKVIGYFHICQKENWEKSFDIIFNEIKKSGLYDKTHEIRLGIVNDESKLIENERLNDPKFKILFCKHSSEYERPTLLHLRNNGVNENNYYWYLHSKGLRHFGEDKYIEQAGEQVLVKEKYILDWINYLLYWNVTKWKFAIKMLSRNWNSYGCNYIYPHYSGNFWWTKSSFLHNLPTEIGNGYTDPEDYISKNNKKMFNIFSSGLEGHGHYRNEYPKEKYEIPDDFDLDAYLKLNYKDFRNNDYWLEYKHLVHHYLNYGKNEGRPYK